MYSSLSSMVIMPFPLIYRMLIYMFPLLSIIIVSYVLFGIMCLNSGRFTFWACHNPRVFMSLTKPILFLCHHKGLHIVIYLDDILVLIHSKWVGKGPACFCVPCWSIFVYVSIFPSLTVASLRPCVSWGYVGILSTCWYLCLLIS